MTWFWRKKESTSVLELWEAIRTLTRKIEDKDLDWADMRARCKRLLDRTEKAATRLQSAEDGANNGEPPAMPNANPIAGRLSDHQREIQQKILRRRAGLS